MAQLTDYQEEIFSDIHNDLKTCYKNYMVLLNLSVNAEKRAISDKSNKFLHDHGIVFEQEKKSQRQKTIECYFNNLRKQIIDNAFVELTATFEKIVFVRIGNATGLARKVIEENYGKNTFHIAISSFIKDANDINRLSSIDNMLKGKISDRLSDKFGEIISYRNRITHGRRFGKETCLTLQDVLETLNEILKLI